MTQTLIRIGLALVVLLAVAGVVGIASAEMAPGVDEQHAHSGEQTHERMNHERVDRHQPTGMDRMAVDYQHGQQKVHEHHSQHGVDEQHGQQGAHEQHGQHGADERHGQQGAHERHGQQGAHEQRGQHGHANGPASGR